jgi:hypothetical protein
MKLNAPTKLVWFISIALAVVGVVFFFIPAVQAYSFWVLLVGWVLMFLGTVLTGF